MAGLSQPVRVRLVAVPTPLNGVRTAWEVVLADNGAEPVAFTTYVDAQTNTVLLREDLVDYSRRTPIRSGLSSRPHRPLDYSVRRHP